jgi:hypothetical protein
MIIYHEHTVLFEKFMLMYSKASINQTDTWVQGLTHLAEEVLHSHRTKPVSPKTPVHHNAMETGISSIDFFCCSQTYTMPRMTARHTAHTYYLTSVHMLWKQG